jgi:hypothetical protein
VEQEFWIEVGLAFKSESPSCPRVCCGLCRCPAWFLSQGHCTISSCCVCCLATSHITNMMPMNEGGISQSMLQNSYGAHWGLTLWRQGHSLIPLPCSAPFPLFLLSSPSIPKHSYLQALLLRKPGSRWTFSLFPNLLYPSPVTSNLYYCKSLLSSFIFSKILLSACYIHCQLLHMYPVPKYPQHWFSNQSVKQAK